jgi:hypothetical protein
LKSDRKLLLAAGLLVVNFAIGLVVSIDQGWAYEFGGIGDPRNVSGQWVSKGTYLAPPLAPAVAFLVALALSRLRGVFGVLGVIGLVIVAVVFLIGIFGEPGDPRGFDPPFGVVLVFRVWSLVAIAGVIAFGVLSLLERRGRGPGRR